MGIFDAIKGKKAARGPGEDQSAILTGFILANGSVLPRAEAIVEAAADLGEPKLTPLPSGEDGILAFQHPAGEFLVTLVTVRFPDLDKMPSSPFSPTVEEMNATSAHFMTALTPGHGDLRQRDLTIARLSGAVALANKAVAVMLGHGVTFNKTARFVASLVEAGADGVPIPGGVDITVANEPNGRASLLTHGMTRYGREDLYVTGEATEPSMKDAYEFTVSIASWLLGTDEKVPDGDTVGRSAEERVKAKRVANPTGAGAPVLRLDL